MGVSERQTAARIKRKHTEASIYLITHFSDVFSYAFKKSAATFNFKMTAVLKSHYQMSINLKVCSPSGDGRRVLLGDGA